MSIAPPPTLAIAPLQNVMLVWQALDRALQRPEHLPGMVAVYGPSGVGKSMAAAWSANKARAYYVELRSTWTKKAMIEAMCREMGMPPARTIYEGVDQVAEQLALSGRPLIVDEADYLVKKSNVEMIRDIYESSHGTVLLIGEENLPQKLGRWERFHNRVLDWVPAQLCSLDDARGLASVYAQIQIADDLLEAVIRQSHGITRRVAVNLDRINHTATAEGWREVTLAQWGKRGFYTGQAPVRGGR